MTKQSILRLLQRMEDHELGVYREIQLRGRPGAWTVDILKADRHQSLGVTGTLDDALTTALRADLETTSRGADLFGPLT